MVFTHHQYMSPVPWMMLVALLAPGCAAPVQVMLYRPRLHPAVAPAPRTDTYTLIADGPSRVESITLAEGDSIGFSQCRGELQAVAGSERVPLADGSYRWVIEPPVNELPAFLRRPQPRTISQAHGADNARNLNRTLAWLAGRAGLRSSSP